MTKPDFLDQLIDQASAAAGSDYKLAQLLETSRQSVSNWRHGHKTCPAGDVALMASIAGLDADAWTARAVAAQYEGTEKGKRLREVLKKALVATGAVIASSSASAAVISGPEIVANWWVLLYTMYRNRKLKARSKQIKADAIFNIAPA